MKRRLYGSGSYTKVAKDKYRVQVSAGIDAQGKRRRISGTAKSEKDASRLILEIKNELAKEAAGIAGPAEIPTSVAMSTSDLFELWFDSGKAGWSPRTIELYRHQLEAHAKPHLGDIPLHDLRPVDIQKMVNALVGEGKIPTANKVRRMVRTALKQAVRWEYINRNPVDAIDPIHEERKDLNLWTRAQARAFIEHHKKHRFYAAFYLLITSGLRRGELLGLRRQDITNEGIHVKQAVVVVNNRPLITKPKSRRSKRFVTLPPDTLQVLKVHLEALDEIIEMVGVSWTHPELVFPSAVGGPMDPQNFSRSWKKAVKAAGLPHVRIHDQRHLHASLLIDLNEDPKVISDRLGHASTSFTLDRYGHLFEERRKRAALPLDSLLGTSTELTDEEKAGGPSDQADVDVAPSTSE